VVIALVFRAGFHSEVYFILKETGFKWTIVFQNETCNLPLIHPLPWISYASWLVYHYFLIWSFKLQMIEQLRRLKRRHSRSYVRHSTTVLDRGWIKARIGTCTFYNLGMRFSALILKWTYVILPILLPRWLDEYRVTYKTKSRWKTKWKGKPGKMTDFRFSLFTIIETHIDIFAEINFV
jgi:hypothetical protein